MQHMVASMHQRLPTLPYMSCNATLGTGIQEHQKWLCTVNSGLGGAGWQTLLGRVSTGSDLSSQQEDKKMNLEYI
jgi:hypothetical protein